MAHDVFISYSREDSRPAYLICGELEASGISCWIAPRDVAAGADHAACIAQAIRQSKALLLVFSAHANASDLLAREVDLAVNESKKLIPIRIEDLQPDNAMKYLLSVAQWLDASSGPIASYTKDIVKNTRRVLNDQDIVPLANPFWRRWRKTAIAAAAVVAAALLTAYLVTTSTPGSGRTAPLSGSWKLDGSDCVLHVGSGNVMFVQYHFSDECRGPVVEEMAQAYVKQFCEQIPRYYKACAVGASKNFPRIPPSGELSTVPTNFLAPDRFHQGDGGTFQMLLKRNGAMYYGIKGSFRNNNGFLGLGPKSMVLNGPGLPSGTWRHVSDGD